MFIYWLIFFIPAIFAIKIPHVSALGYLPPKYLDFFWKMVLVFLVCMIGFRHQVGGDWINYLNNMENLRFVNLNDLNLSKEQGFSFLIWLGNFWGGIYLFNLVSGALFSYGLIKFCLNLPRSWLALTMAIPYMVIVVAMGYSRQAAALGVFMLGLLALEKQQIWRFLVYLILGYLFHLTVIFLSPLALMFRKQGAKGENLLLYLFVFPFVYELYVLIMQEYGQGYIQSAYNSSGALLRIGLNAITALVYLLIKPRFIMSKNWHKICYILSLLSFFLFFLLFFISSSAAIDRFGLYLLPLQLLVWSQLPDALMKKPGNQQLVVLTLIFLYAFEQFVWLFFSNYSGDWLPYRFYWWEVLTDRIWIGNSISSY